MIVVYRNDLGVTSAVGLAADGVRSEADALARMVGPVRPKPKPAPRPVQQQRPARKPSAARPAPSRPVELTRRDEALVLASLGRSHPELSPAGLAGLLGLMVRESATSAEARLYLGQMIAEPVPFGSLPPSLNGDGDQAGPTTSGPVSYSALDRAARAVRRVKGSWG